MAGVGALAQTRASASGKSMASRNRFGIINGSKYGNNGGGISIALRAAYRGCISAAAPLHTMRRRRPHAPITIASRCGMA